MYKVENNLILFGIEKEGRDFGRGNGFRMHFTTYSKIK